MRQNYLILIFVFISIYSCKNDDDNTTDDIINLKITDDLGQNIDSAVANGETLVILEASISPDADNSIQNIEFNKSNGEFLGITGATATRPIDENGTASITVKVPNSVERLFFNCKVSFNGRDFFSEADLDINRAYPDSLIIEPSTVNVTLPATVILNTFLLRTEGTVSEDTKAEFSAYQVIDETNVEVGRFTGLNDAFTDQEGLITVNFHTDTNDIDTSIPVFIKAESMTNSGESIETSIEIMVN